ncbi:uncharacterized protein LOC103978446 isoform X1 [Musa acuminata AAA Group]|uniref:uncharacterized protein LOC103978446 isoform X1 n=1 Tax=Musa acuminata AAA Group TaxID=214697 RepID=UPI0031DCEF5D
MALLPPNTRKQQQSFLAASFSSSSSPHQTPNKAEGEEDMPKLCTYGTPSLLPAYLLEDFISLCTFFTSHPLHLAYLLLFLPYLLHLLSFLSPLLLSTSILLLVLLTVSPYLDEAPPAAAPPDFLGRTCCVVLDVLKDKLQDNGELDLVEQFTSMVLSPIDNTRPFGELVEGACSGHEAEERHPGQVGSGESRTPATDGENLVPINGVAEHPKGREAVEHKPGAGEHLTRSMSERRTHSISGTTESLQRYGSVRKEREWKRTLACKLYEERMTHKLYKQGKVGEGGQEMDLLWEAYEANAGEAGARKKKAKKKAKRADVGEEEEEQEEAAVGQLCCLQALRLSAGKMNLGMRKHNLMKISKVLKEMKMFHSGSKS